MRFIVHTKLSVGFTMMGIVLVSEATIYALIPYFPPIPIDYNIDIMPIDF